MIFCRFERNFRDDRTILFRNYSPQKTDESVGHEMSTRFSGLRSSEWRERGKKHIFILLRILGTRVFDP